MDSAQTFEAEAAYEDMTGGQRQRDIDSRLNIGPRHARRRFELGSRESKKSVRWASPLTDFQGQPRDDEHLGSRGHRNQRRRIDKSKNKMTIMFI